MLGLARCRDAERCGGAKEEPPPMAPYRHEQWLQVAHTRAVARPGRQDGPHLVGLGVKLLVRPVTHFFSPKIFWQSTVQGSWQSEALRSLPCQYYYRNRYYWFDYY